MPVPGEYSLLRQTAAENPGTRGQSGFAALGNALAGGNEATGEMAFARGQQIGAQTIDALAQARARVRANEAAESTAAFIESDQGKPLGDMLGVTDDMRHYIAATVLGQGEEAGAKVALDLAQEARRSRIEKGSADPRVGAALALTPAEVIPKAIGQAGSITQPLNYDPNRPATATFISPEQTALNTAQENQRGASAENSLASAAEKAGKPLPLQHGFRWKTDENGGLVTDAKGAPIQEPDPAAGTSAVGRRYAQVVNGSANLIKGEVHNISGLGYSTTRGAQGIAGAHPGVLGFLTTNLGKGLSSTEQQEYETTVNNIGRALSQIETQGRMPPGSMTAQLDKLKAEPTTTEQAKLYNLGLIRQILENQETTVSSNPDATPAMQKVFRDALASIKKDIPWEPLDVLEFSRTGGNSTFKDFLKGKGHDVSGYENPAATGKPSAAPAKPGAAPAAAAGPAALSAEDQAMLQRITKRAAGQ